MTTKEVGENGWSFFFLFFTIGFFPRLPTTCISSSSLFASFATIKSFATWGSSTSMHSSSESSCDCFLDCFFFFCFGCDGVLALALIVKSISVAFRFTTPAGVFFFFGISVVGGEAGTLDVESLWTSRAGSRAVKS